MKRKKVTDEITDKEIFLMTEGLTPELIGVKNKEMMKEFEQLKKDLDMDEDDDDTEVYRGFIGHKIAALMNVSEHILRQINNIYELLADLAEASNEKE